MNILEQSVSYVFAVLFTRLGTLPVNFLFKALCKAVVEEKSACVVRRCWVFYPVWRSCKGITERLD